MDKKSKRRNGEGSWGTKVVNGITYKRFRDANGKDYYGKTEKEVREKIRAASVELSIENSEKDVRKMPFGELVIKWIEETKLLELKPNTASNYMDCMNGQLLNNEDSELASLQVGTITADDFNRYYAKMAKNYSSGTISKNHTILSQCIRYCNKKGYFKNKIDLEDIRIPNKENIAKEDREIHILNDEDIIKLTKEAYRINAPGYKWGGKIGEPTYGNNAKLLIFILNTGLRISEAIELCWEDVHMDEKGKAPYIYVHRNSARIRTETKGVRKEVISSPKTRHSTRYVPLNGQALKILKEERRLYDTFRSRYVFVTENGDKIKSRQNVARTLRDMVARADLSVDHLTPHELRHTFGSALLRQGVDINTVSEILGHSSPEITRKIYIHVLEEQKINAINMIDFKKDIKDNKNEPKE